MQGSLHNRNTSRVGIGYNFKLITNDCYVIHICVHFEICHHFSLADNNTLSNKTDFYSSGSFSRNCLFVPKVRAVRLVLTLSP